MKETLTVLMLCMAISVNAQITTPHLSPDAMVTQKVGLVDISIEYSRPGARGRTIFDAKSGLLPYGEFWRTGANTATKITFSDSISVGGHAMPRGEYTILSKPGATEWQISWFKYESSNWTSYVSKPALFVLEVPVTSINRHVETFGIRIEDITMNSASMVLEWERTRLVIPLKLNEDQKILSSIERTLNGPGKADYFQAALYLHESGGDLNKALEYIRKVTAYENALFFEVTREAMILRDLGQKGEALKSAKRGLSLSKKVRSADFIRLNNKLIKELSTD